MAIPIEELECTAAESNAVKALVRSMCANYDESRKMCAPSGEPCKMLGKDLRRNSICKYFSKCVLPLNPELEASIKKTIVDKKVCGVCGNSFVPVNNRAKYCALCSEKMRLQRQRSYMRKRRAKC